MYWRVSNQCEPAALALADRHYSRSKVGGRTMMPPGRQVVLLTEDMRAVWGSAWPKPEMTDMAWLKGRDGWLCTIFRNEGDVLSSTLVREAVAATRWKWGDAPEMGMVTFIDAGKVRHKRDQGRCFRKAGFRPIGETASGLLVLQLLPDAMPAPEPPLGVALRLF